MTTTSSTTIIKMIGKRFKRQNKGAKLEMRESEKIKLLTCALSNDNVVRSIYKSCTSHYAHENSRSMLAYIMNTTENLTILGSKHSKLQHLTYMETLT